MSTSSRPFDGTHAVIVNGKVHRFVCPVEANTARLADIDRQLRELSGERTEVAIVLRRLRGLRAYAEITANDNRLDEVDE